MQDQLSKCVMLLGSKNNEALRTVGCQGVKSAGSMVDIGVFRGGIMLWLMVEAVLSEVVLSM